MLFNGRFLIVVFLLISSFSYSQSVVEVSDLERARFDSTSVGGIVPLFSIEDSALNSVEISTFKGVNLVVDIWATWCMPCLKEAPYFHKLKETYENDKLKFISISIDNFHKEWLEYLIVKGLGKQGQYFAGYNDDHPIIWFVTNIGKDKEEEYTYTMLPRFLIIDKDQKIVNRQAGIPSEEKLLEQIKALK
ncbi:TlpA family protein disulfide reductase [Vicingaceae bacterium]|nr:TlpA family protein disulfide reductase [Vicingaceae bacterium]